VLGGETLRVGFEGDLGPSVQTPAHGHEQAVEVRGAQQTRGTSAEVDGGPPGFGNRNVVELGQDPLQPRPGVWAPDLAGKGTPVAFAPAKRNVDVETEFRQRLPNSWGGQYFRRAAPWMEDRLTGPQVRESPPMLRWSARTKYSSSPKTSSLMF
jgi:hypothetical protein